MNVVTSNLVCYIWHMKGYILTISFDIKFTSKLKTSSIIALTNYIKQPCVTYAKKYSGSKVVRQKPSQKNKVMQTEDEHP